MKPMAAKKKTIKKKAGATSKKAIKPAIKSTNKNKSAVRGKTLTAKKKRLVGRATLKVNAKVNSAKAKASSKSAKSKVTPVANKTTSRPSKPTQRAKASALLAKAALEKARLVARAPAKEITRPTTQIKVSAIKSKAEIALAKPGAPAKSPAPAKPVASAPVAAAQQVESRVQSVNAAPVTAAQPIKIHATHSVPPVLKVQAAPSVAAPKIAKPTSHRHGFKMNEAVVYPAHGVGQIVSIEEQEVAGFKLELYVINFSKDKMTLRVPTSKVAGVGMRKLAEPEVAKRALDILTGRARIKRTMWSRRAQEYEAKINSGDINSIAEVVRDLYRSDAQPEQSYSERQLYEAALDRIAREIAAVEKLSEPEAVKLIEGQLQKGQKRVPKAEAAAVVELGETEVEEAA